MRESLLSASNIILFGRLFPLSVDTDQDGKNKDKADKDEKGALPGSNTFLRKQLNAPGARLARIYAFSYEGGFYNLPKPAVFLVHGEGTPIAGFVDSKAFPPGVSNSGLIARDFGFEPDAKFWEYDKSDLTLRLDIVSGSFDEVLLDAALSMTARDALTSRSDLAARSDMASRSDLASRSDVTSRSDLALRHRLKG
jgi:hypothetical protein